MKKLRIMLIIFAAGLSAAPAIGESLTLSDTPSMMYWTDSSIKKIQRANLDGSGVRDLIAAGLGRPHGMALDPSSGKMYWTDLNFDSIQRANLDGSHIETLVATGSIAPIGITLDVEAGKMYWTDSASHKIQRANLNGSGIEDLVTTGLQWPQGIALDVTGGKMYWTDGGTVKIQRSNLDGSGVEDLYSMSFGAGAPIGIALDVCGGKMYWTDVVNHRIQRANMNGSNVEILVTTGGNLRGIALDAAAGKMYWTDTLFDKIQRANLNGTGIEDLVTTGLDYPIGLALDVPKPPKIIYVDADASGANSGSSWADAYNSLLSALGAAESGGEIRVAEGIYKPTGYVTPPPSPMGGSNTDEIVATAEDRSATFYLVNGVAIQGGYAGFGEQDPDVRDPNTYETILSGDVGIEGNNSDNCYHVLCCVLVDATAVLDGVTITGGNANEEYPSQHSCGGGMYNIFSSPTLNNCTFSRNSASRDGGGMFNSEQSNPTLTNCTFTGNSTIYDGGAMCNRTSSPTITNCTFTGNSANHGAGISNWPGSPILTACTFIGNSAELGGAVFNWDSSPKLTDCLFSSNSAREWGGAICNLSNSSPTLVSCTFNGNRAGDHGNGMNNHINSYPMVTNCIFWDGGDEIYNTDGSTTMITYSDVQGGWTGEGNIDTDPCFVNVEYVAPISYWKFEECNGTTAYDSLGQNHGTIYGAQWINGQVGSALAFDGMDDYKDDYVDVPDFPDLNSQLFTAEAWIKTSTTSFYGTFGTILVKGRVFNENYGLYVYQSGWVRWQYTSGGVWGDTTKYVFLDSSKVVNDGQFHHIVGTYDGEELKIYIDGSLDSSRAETKVPDKNNLSLRIGRRNNPGDIPLYSAVPFDGIIDEVAIYDRALSADEIRQHYQSCLSGQGYPHVPDYHLWPDSPCIDAGDPNYVAGPNETDLDGNPRVIGGRIDMGAYEFQNTPPVADAGADQVVECECNTEVGTKITLDGSGSYDVDGDPLTYTWSGPFVESPVHGATPTVTLEDGCPGEYVVTLVVNDGIEDSKPDEVLVTVVDTTPPVISCPADVTLECPADTGVEASGSATGIDTCGTVTITHSDQWHPGCGSTGILTRTWTATDECGNESSCVQVITVVDTTPTEFTFSVTPNMLWPPNHKMVEITPSWTVSDECDQSPDVSLVGIVANEGDNTIGDGHTTDDIQINEDGSIFLRSERSGTGTDRIYTITYQAVDDCGNTTVRSATVSIPHDFKVLARIASRWLWSGPAGRIPEDLNADGIVNLADVARFAGNWTK